MALHRRPGGGRIIDALGRDDAQITFSGVFSGSNTTLRARSIDELGLDDEAMAEVVISAAVDVRLGLPEFPLLQPTGGAVRVVDVEPVKVERANLLDWRFHQEVEEVRTAATKADHRHDVVTELG